MMTFAQFLRYAAKVGLAYLVMSVSVGLLCVLGIAFVNRPEGTALFVGGAIVGAALAFVLRHVGHSLHETVHGRIA